MLASLPSANQRYINDGKFVFFNNYLIWCALKKWCAACKLSYEASDMKRAEPLWKPLLSKQRHLP